MIILGKDKKSLILNPISLLRRISIMANIIIPNLRPAGSDLFSDSESFLNDITDQETVQVFGGRLIIGKRVVIDFSWRNKIDVIIKRGPRK